jgi:hypothetical protein
LRDDRGGKRREGEERVNRNRGQNAKVVDELGEREMREEEE